MNYAIFNYAFGFLLLTIFLACTKSDLQTNSPCIEEIGNVYQIETQEDVDSISCYVEEREVLDFSLWVFINEELDLTIFEHVKELNGLYIFANTEVDINQFKNLEKLSQLILNGEITQVEFNALKELRDISLESMPILNIASFPLLRKAKSVFISDIPILEELGFLQNVDINQHFILQDCNMIKDLSFKMDNFSVEALVTNNSMLSEIHISSSHQSSNLSNLIMEDNPLLEKITVENVETVSRIEVLGTQKVKVDIGTITNIYGNLKIENLDKIEMVNISSLLYLSELVLSSKKIEFDTQFNNMLEVLGSLYIQNYEESNIDYNTLHSLNEMCESITIISDIEPSDLCGLQYFTEQYPQRLIVYASNQTPLFGGQEVNDSCN